MVVTGIKTHKITQKDKDIYKVLAMYISKLSEKSIVAVASKIVAITEGRVVKIQSSESRIQNSNKQKDLYLQIY